MSFNVYFMLFKKKGYYSLVSCNLNRKKTVEKMTILFEKIKND